MLHKFIRSSPYRIILFIITAVLFFSCQKSLDFENSGGSVQPPDLSTKISSSVSGFVTDENDAAVMGATVVVGSSTITTDKYGYFEVKNAQVVKTAAVVTVNKPGYFKGIKTYMATEGKSAFFRIKLIPKIIAGTVNAASGGTVTLPNGLSVKLNAGTIVNASTNAQYNGSVNVAAYWINPAATDLPNIMPGDLRGINTEGALKLLQTYGMAAVELTGSSGELLQIVNGQKATLTFPIPSSISGTAPASIPLWYFDETKGLWKQEGSATKTGNIYTGEVGHFSYWNCDYPFPNSVQFDCTLVDANGNPLPNLEVWINYPSGQITGCHGTTNENGYATGPIPANSQLVLKVYSNAPGCNNVAIHSQNFTTTSSNISLGTITVSNNSNTAVVTGTLKDCNNQPVTNGYVMMYLGNQFSRFNVSNGNFSFSTFICGNNNTAMFIGGDIATNQESSVLNYTLQSGANNIGNLMACGTTTNEFVNYSVNGINYSVTLPTDTIHVYGSNTSAIIIEAGQVAAVNSISLSFDAVGIGVNSSQALTFLGTRPQMNIPTIPNPIMVHITEYGAIGQFIAGNLSGTITESLPPNTSYNVTCSFRVRRTF